VKGNGNGWTCAMSNSCPAVLYDLGSGSWLAWTNGTVVHYALMDDGRQTHYHANGPHYTHKPFHYWRVDTLITATSYKSTDFIFFQIYHPLVIARMKLSIRSVIITGPPSFHRNNLGAWCWANCYTRIAHTTTTYAVISLSCNECLNVKPVYMAPDFNCCAMFFSQ